MEPRKAKTDLLLRVESLIADKSKECFGSLNRILESGFRVSNKLAVFSASGLIASSLSIFCFTK